MQLGNLFFPLDIYHLYIYLLNSYGLKTSLSVSETHPFSYYSSPREGPFLPYYNNTIPIITPAS